ncbi:MULTISPECIES: hypothetical protein [Pseudomonadaceae]|uniref:hypothetical protein n=1 Tax=Pseudomonadaceae TaxID=135621 RepID=UPI0007736256|nr:MULTISPECIES: hypothetical protein [Pseudomonas]KXK70110.1 hypothetical protein BC89_15510 [Pseudomonas monteilii]MCO7620662.1 hypothetical protein [Pseudomonas guariconensis]MCU9531424.1 hypothetical protein [Pseudomonas mosselii]MCU9537683.1 hypothetical protein [Pseudomonas mosselii]MCU9544606.1 hypothetical protein [Pseudomonas mosselii]
MDNFQMLILVPLIALGLYRVITKPGIHADRLLSLRNRTRIAHLITFGLAPGTLLGYEAWGTLGVAAPLMLGVALICWLLPEPWSAP